MTPARLPAFFGGHTPSASSSFFPSFLTPSTFILSSARQPYFSPVAASARFLLLPATKTSDSSLEPTSRSSSASRLTRASNAAAAPSTAPPTTPARSSTQRKSFL